MSLGMYKANEWAILVSKFPYLQMKIFSVQSNHVFPSLLGVKENQFSPIRMLFFSV